MSYALSVYLVSHQQLSRFPGVDDPKLLRDCLARAAERLQELDDEFYDEDEEDQIPHEQAFRELFSGRFTAEYAGGTYGWAFEALCACLGEPLSNEGFSPCDIEWYEQLDEQLAAAGAQARLLKLIGSCPIEMPQPDDFPAIGQWTHAELVASAPMIARLAAEADDPEVAEAFGTASQWCHAVSQDADLCIVAFHG